jgi:hypothetical protein
MKVLGFGAGSRPDTQSCDFIAERCEIAYLMDVWL